MDKIVKIETYEFFDNVAQLIEQARRYVSRTTDYTKCVTYYEIGRMIIEEEQDGKARAAYGKKLLYNLSIYLKNRCGSGFSETNLRNARKFYRTFSTTIQQTISAKLSNRISKQIQQTISAESQKPEFAKNETTVNVFDDIRQSLSVRNNPFSLSWSHYLVLMRIDNEQERRFYEIEAINQNWTYEHLCEQYNKSLYERLALSRDKDAVIKLANEGNTIKNPADILKNPLTLEFLGLEEYPEYSEDDLENAILSKLQKFLCEMGKGFLYEARQKRFTFNEKHYKVDLVCYNRLLRCYVLIDLKTDSLEHRDLGQMQMYVHYYDRYVKTNEENPTIGILLCKEKDDAIVELTLPEGENIYASEYSLYLPDKDTLQSKLAEWIEEFENKQEMLKLVNEGAVE